VRRFFVQCEIKIELLKRFRLGRSKPSRASIVQETQYRNRATISEVATAQEVPQQAQNAEFQWHTPCWIYCR
jgi:hypothetical protein